MLLPIGFSLIHSFSERNIRKFRKDQSELLYGQLFVRDRPLILLDGLKPLSKLLLRIVETMLKEPLDLTSRRLEMAWLTAGKPRCGKLALAVS